MKTNAKIYVMQAEDGTIKLGHSVDPARRSKQLGRVVSVVHETDVLEQVERIERLAHRVLALHGKHIRGEWFEATLNDALHAITIATRQAEHEELALGGNLVRERTQILEHDQHFHLRVGEEFFQRLDDLRALERPMPSRAEWIRRVVDEAYTRQIASRVRK